MAAEKANGAGKLTAHYTHTVNPKWRTTPFINNFRFRTHKLSPFNVAERSRAPRSENIFVQH